MHVVHIYCTGNCNILETVNFISMKSSRENQRMWCTGGATNAGPSSPRNTRPLLGESTFCICYLKLMHLEIKKSQIIFLHIFFLLSSCCTYCGDKVSPADMFIYIYIFFFIGQLICLYDQTKYRGPWIWICQVHAIAEDRTSFIIGSISIKCIGFLVWTKSFKKGDHFPFLANIGWNWHIPWHLFINHFYRQHKTATKSSFKLVRRLALKFVFSLKIWEKIIFSFCHL